jgi:hypothetical protein
MPATTWESTIQSGQGIVLATLERVDSAGVPWVHWPGDPPTAARVTRAVTTDDLHRAAESGTRVVVVLENGDRARPIILGVLATEDTSPKDEAPPLEARVDGRAVVLTGEEEITLRCGQASVTLTRAGKILLRGAYISSRSSGVNRIKGGSVQIN